MLRIAGQPHRAGNNCRWKVRDRRRKLPDCTRRPFGVFRRGLRTPAVRKHVSGADGIHFWLAPTVKPDACGFFSFFSFRKEKNTLLLFTGENMYFSPQGEKIPKELLRLPPQTPIYLLRSTYPRLPTDGTAHLRALSVIRRAGSNCRWEACARRRKARAV